MIGSKSAAGVRYKVSSCRRVITMEKMKDRRWSTAAVHLYHLTNGKRLAQQSFLWCGRYINHWFWGKVLARVNAQSSGPSSTAMAQTETLCKVEVARESATCK
jgi:hypothetical protein